MSTAGYTTADMRRQRAAWRRAAHCYLRGDAHGATVALLGDHDRPDLQVYCEMVAMATLGACLTGQIIAARQNLQPDEHLEAWRRDPAVEPSAAHQVAIGMVVNAANGELYEVARQVNAWACFDRAGLERMTDLLARLLQMFCEAAA